MTARMPPLMETAGDDAYNGDGGGDGGGPVTMRWLPMMKTTMMRMMAMRIMMARVRMLPMVSTAAAVLSCAHAEHEL